VRFRLDSTLSPYTILVSPRVTNKQTHGSSERMAVWLDAYTVAALSERPVSPSVPHVDRVGARWATATGKNALDAPGKKEEVLAILGTKK
jgi:hypothetical protein